MEVRMSPRTIPSSRPAEEATNVSPRRPRSERSPGDGSCIDHFCPRDHPMWLSANDQRARLIAFLLCCTFALYLLSAFAPTGWQTAHGQDAAPAGDNQNADKPKPSTNLVLHIIKSAGIVFGPLLLLISVGLIALIILLFMDLRLGAAIPVGFVEDFTDTVN